MKFTVAAILLAIQTASALPTDEKTVRAPAPALDANLEARCDCGWNLCCNSEDNCSISLDYCLENCPMGDGGVSCIISCTQWCG